MDAASNNHKDRNGRKAFTLIELLVVIAIISLLASILLPSLKMAKDLANSAVCKNNLRGLVVGANLYASDNDGTLPGVIFPTWWWGSNVTQSFWFLEVGPYVEVEWGYGYTTKPHGKRTIFCCPSVPDFTLSTSIVAGNHYSYNMELSYRRKSDITRTGVALLADAKEYMFINDRFSGMVTHYHWKTGLWARLPFGRHVDGINLADFDGSVRAGTEETITAHDVDDAAN